MTPETRARLDEIRERERAATEGPWRQSQYATNYVAVRDDSDDDEGETIVKCYQKTETKGINHDAIFIALIRNETPFLLKLIEEQAREIENRSPRIWRSVSEAKDDVMIELAEPSFGERAIGKFEDGLFFLSGNELPFSRESLAEDGWIFTEAVGDLPDGFVKVWGEPGTPTRTC